VFISDSTTFIPLNLPSGRRSRLVDAPAAPRIVQTKNTLLPYKFFVVDESLPALPPVFWRAYKGGQVFHRTTTPPARLNKPHKVFVYESVIGTCPENHKISYLNGDPLDLRKENLMYVPKLLLVPRYKPNSVVETLRGYDAAVRFRLENEADVIRTYAGGSSWAIARGCGSVMTPEVVSKLLHFYTNQFTPSELPQEYPHNELPMGYDMDTVQCFLSEECGIHDYTTVQVRRILKGDTLRIPGHLVQYWMCRRLLPNAVSRGFARANRYAGGMLEADAWRAAHREKREQIESIRQQQASQNVT
jgi:hypothetical protein